MDGVGFRCEASFANTTGKDTPCWNHNPIAVVPYIPGYDPLKDHLSYTLDKRMNSSGNCTNSEMWAADWWWKTQASFLVLSGRLFLVRISLYLGDLQCQTEHVRECMSERACERKCVRDIVSE